MRVEFVTLTNDAVFATATLDDAGKAIVTAAPDSTIDPSFIERAYVTEPDGTEVTPADGERYLRALPGTFRSQAVYARLLLALLLLSG